MPRFVSGLLCLLFFPSMLFSKDVTIHGFVTEVRSATSFEIDDYKITRDNTVLLDMNSAEADKAQGNFKAEDIRVGTELEIKGEYDEKSGELKAKSIKVFLEDNGKIKRNALLEQIPVLIKKGSGWEGEIHADGQRILVSPATSIAMKPNKSERESLAGKKKDADSMKLTSLDALNLDTFIRYTGTRQADGSIQADKIEFEHSELEGGEVKLRKHFDPKIKDPNYASFAPGELQMHWKRYLLLPSKQAQEYVSALGESLIPAHQKEMAADNPLKIPFRFYLVEAKSFNAVAYPNGVVVVHSGVFDMLQNEAQLAFVLSHEISHAVEKHVWQEQHYHRAELIALQAGGAFIPFGGSLVTSLAAASIQSQYARSLENQADRVGLEWMLAAGYDIREAPASWKALSEKKGDRLVNPFWDSHDNHTTRRSYLMAELRNNYSGVDYSKLKKDSEQFHIVGDIVKKHENDKKDWDVE